MPFPARQTEGRSRTRCRQVDACVCVNSWTELRRDGEWLRQCLAGRPGPVVAVSDYVRAVPDLIRPFMDRPMVTLGTDGFGRSDTRAALRGYFGVDRAAIVEAARGFRWPG